MHEGFVDFFVSRGSRFLEVDGPVAEADVFDSGGPEVPSDCMDASVGKVAAVLTILDALVWYDAADA